MLVDRYHESIALAEQAIAIARAVGASAEAGHALNTRGRSRSLLGDCPGGLADLREALRIALEVRQADDIGRGFVNLTDELHDCGETSDALAEVTLGIKIADEYGIGHMYGYYIRLNGVNAAYALGRWDEARRLLEEALARGPSGSGAEIYRLANTLPFLVGEGSFEAADIGIARGLALLDNNPGAQFIGPVHVAAAERALWRRAPLEALELALAGMRLVGNTDDRVHRLRLCRIGAWAAADLALLGRDLRDDSMVVEARNRIAEFGVWLDEAARVLTAPGGNRELGATQATFDGEARRVDGDVDATPWGDAADRWAELGRPYMTAYARWREAEAALLARDRATATRSLEEARAIASRLGAAPLLEEVEALARRARIVPAGAEPAPDEAEGRQSSQFGLTGREREVLGLLVDGRSNRQIADLLFISQNTAGVHVSNILGKLGVASRGEAAALAHRQGLVPAEPAPPRPDTASPSGTNS
jgi:DNA-binding CsgD family transcriptional regulator